MKRLLRSIIDFGGITREELVHNFQRLQHAELNWDQAAHGKIYSFLFTFFKAHLELPNKTTVTTHFEKKNDIEVLESLKDIEACLPAPHKYSNFAYLLSEIHETQSRAKFMGLLQEARKISLEGITKTDERGKPTEKLQGVKDAVQYLMSGGMGLILTEMNAKVRGDIREDTEGAWKEYQLAKNSKDQVYGSFCGISNFDKVMKGLRRGDLWIHAGFAGELKSTFASNWAYHAMTRYRRNSYYVSLEMKYEHIRRLICVLHSTNRRFTDAGFPPLDYRKVRDGELSPGEEAHYRAVLDDLGTNPEYAAFDVYGPDRDLDMDAIKLEIETSNQRKEVGLIIIDHGGLVEARKSKRNKDYTVELNSVIRDAKKLALQFNHGQGAPVLLLFQINRQGKDSADKSDGEYKMSALSYANEAERSASIITTTYLNKDLRDQGRVRFSCLKNRDDPLIEPFEAGVNFAQRRLYNLNPFENAGRGISIDDATQMQTLLS
jgi:replicative DNA helicase